MKSLKQLLEVGFEFHGHHCPAMPLGLRAGLAAMNALGVERSQSHELHLISETGKAHAGGCFLDGLMMATGCTYGKSNIEKKYYNKFAFTLIDTEKGKAVRATLKPAFVEKMLQSPFVIERSKGKKPQEIPSEVLAPLLENVLSMPEEKFIEVGSVTDWTWEKTPSVFEVAACDGCGEMTFVNKLSERDGKRLCPSCIKVAS